MTILHMKSKSGPDGKANLNLGEVNVGVPNAEVDVTISVPQPTLTQDQWRAEMERVLESMSDVHLEELPRTPYKDPWREE